MAQPTKEEIKLALPCYDAIKVIVGERECPRCRGIEAVAAVDGSFVCPKCKGLGKVGYVWKPEVGDWCIWGEWLGIVGRRDREGYVEILLESESTTRLAVYDSLIPILPWETIEKILKKTEGYSLRIREFNEAFDDWKWKGSFVCLLHYQSNRKTFRVKRNAKSRQEVVMLAVIALAKELKNDAK